MQAPVGCDCSAGRVMSTRKPLPDQEPTPDPAPPDSPEAKRRPLFSKVDDVLKHFKDDHVSVRVLVLFIMELRQIATALAVCLVLWSRHL